MAALVLWWMTPWADVPTAISIASSTSSPRGGLHRPADDLTAPGVEHDGEIEKPRHCRHISDVGDPQLVRSGSVKSRSTKSGAGRSSLFRRVVSGHRADDWRPPGLPHASDGRSACGCASLHAHADRHEREEPRKSPRTACTVLMRFNKAASAVARADGGRAPGIDRLDTPSTRAIAAIGKQAWSRSEPEEPDGSVPVPGQPGRGFERISRSSRSCLFSRRSRVNSSRSNAVRPGAASSRRPSFRSTWATHARMEWPLGSNSRARSSGLRQHGRGRPSVGETPANMVDVFLASAAPLARD